MLLFFKYYDPATGIISYMGHYVEFIVNKLGKKCWLVEELQFRLMEFFVCLFVCAYSQLDSTAERVGWSTKLRPSHHV